MSKTRDLLAVFNRGRVSNLALARVDVSRIALSASIQTNWMPRALGSMMLRPGWEYLATAAGDGALLPFVFTTSDVALVELTASQLRVFDDGDTLVSRASVSTSITNGDFTSDLASWTDDDETGAASTWVSGQMQLLGTGYALARRYQAVSVAGGDQNTVHGLRIVVNQGACLLRIGTSANDDDVFRQAVLRKGTHSIAFTPGAATVYVELSSSLSYPVLIESVAIEAAGTMTLPTPWATADECKAVRWSQSADVIFCASDYQPRRIERRSDNSWSIVAYEPTDGPFLTENTENITLTPSAISGAITLTSSRALFREDHEGAIFKLSSQGQLVEVDVTAENTWSDSIRVTGVGNDRRFNVTRAGTWTATVTLQRSIGEPGSWVDVTTYTANGTATYDDGLDNSVVYYRIGIDTGDFSSGTAELSLEFSGGSITGTVRVTDYTNTTQVSAVVLKSLGGTDATEIWAEGAWSDVQGWPTSVALWEGRIWWQGNGRNYASVSDVLTSFDPDYEGDAGPINRYIGDGVVNDAKWALPLQRLVIGTDGAEHAIRSTSFDEPVTPSNYNSKAPSTNGSADIPAAMTSGTGYFVDRTGRGVFEMVYSAEAYDYAAQERTLLIPEITDPGIARIAIQQRPDVRLHCVKSDGTVAVMVRDIVENVTCWVDVTTDGEVEDVVVLPGTVEDQVIYRVKRTINGITVRYIEKWAREDQCQGGTLNRQADSFLTGSGSVTGLDHLEGEEVVVWADGVDQGTFTVSSGAIGESYTSWVAGLGYRARYKSAKLISQTQAGHDVGLRRRIETLGLMLANTHAQGLTFGPDFDNLDSLPVDENGADVDGDYIWDSYDEDMIEFPGEWGTDERFCLEANAPRPCTVLAAIVSVERDLAG